MVSDISCVSRCVVSLPGLLFQLKHCSKQVNDILMPLIKNLDIERVKLLLKLISGLETSSHTEQVRVLYSVLRFL